MDKVQHFEIPADDTERARKFYEDSFGWKTKDYPMPDGSEYIGLYTGPVDDKNMMKEPGFINGGMFRQKEEMRMPGPTVYVTVDDLEKSIDKIEKAGGQILMPPKEIEGMGRFTYAKDTEENIIGVFQNLRKE